MSRVTIVCALMICAESIVVSARGARGHRRAGWRLIARFRPGPHRSAGSRKARQTSGRRSGMLLGVRAVGASCDYIPAGVAQAFAFKSCNGRVRSLIADVSAGSGAKRLQAGLHGVAPDPGRGSGRRYIATRACQAAHPWLPGMPRVSPAGRRSRPSCASFPRLLGFRSPLTRAARGCGIGAGTYLSTARPPSPGRAASCTILSTRAGAVGRELVCGVPARFERNATQFLHLARSRGLAVSRHGHLDPSPERVPRDRDSRGT